MENKCPLPQKEDNFENTHKGDAMLLHFGQILLPAGGPLTLGSHLAFLSYRGTQSDRSFRHPRCTVTAELKQGLVSAPML